MTLTQDRPRTPEIIMTRSWVPDDLDYKLRSWSPRSHLGRYVKDVIGKQLPADMMAELIEMFSKAVIVESKLSLVAFFHPDNPRGGLPLVCDFGVVGDKVVTDTGVGYVVDAFQNSVEMENQKFHGLGTGTTAESAAHTALVTELTTEYTGDVRATGTTAEGASANIFSTVATNTLDGTPGAALREHSVFSASTVGVMLDRTLFSAITLSSGDALQSTYQLTFSSGG